MKNILEKFGLSGILSVTKLNNGHINSSYLVDCPKGRYVLQNLSSTIFPEPEIVMRNISRIEKAFRANPNEKITVPHYLEADGRNYAEENGRIWRVYEYTEEQENFPRKSYYHGLAVGTFLRIVNTGGIEFEKPLAEFHDMNNSSLPIRNIHGDTKADNIIFGDNITVIDLDTATRGYIAADYGDMIRSVTSESVDLQVIREATEGFARGIGEIMTEAEIASLYDGAVFIIGELAQRYAEGQKKFPNRTPEQCAKRERELISQLDEIISHENEIRDIIKISCIRRIGGNYSQRQKQFDVDYKI